MVTVQLPGLPWLAEQDADQPPDIAAPGDDRMFALGVDLIMFEQEDAMGRCRQVGGNAFYHFSHIDRVKSSTSLSGLIALITFVADMAGQELYQDTIHIGVVIQFLDFLQQLEFEIVSSIRIRLT